MLGPQDERTLMLNARTTYDKSPGKNINDSTLSRDVRTINNRTTINRNFVGK